MTIETFLEKVTDKDNNLLRKIAIDIIEEMNYFDFHELCEEMRGLIILKKSMQGLSVEMKQLLFLKNSLTHPEINECNYCKILSNDNSKR